MTLPVFAVHEPGQALLLGTALLLGLGFGFCLERAGFGSARRLVAVFYLYDMAVVKVMFTAIVTAMTGLALLAVTGLLDLSWVYVEPTRLPAQALGGLIFGAGFIVGGYCPGTAVAAMATGRRDGVAFALGMLAGVASYAELAPGVEAWVADGGAEQTLSGATGVHRLWWTAMFIVVLVLAARLLAWLERRFAANRPSA